MNVHFVNWNYFSLIMNLEQTYQQLMTLWIYFLMNHFQSWPFHCVLYYQQPFVFSNMNINKVDGTSFHIDTTLDCRVAIQPVPKRFHYIFWIFSFYLFSYDNLLSEIVLPNDFSYNLLNFLLLEFCLIISFLFSVFICERLMKILMRIQMKMPQFINLWKNDN